VLDALKKLPHSFSSHKKIGVAFSGGPDSFVLLKILEECLVPLGIKIYAVTVDHGIRPESCEEAAAVHNAVRDSQTIHHSVLTLKLSAKTSQATARYRRYLALAEYFHAKNVAIVFLGHHQDDQLETFFIRLGAGSKPYGLGCMHAEMWQHGILWVRPLLDWPKTWIKFLAEKQKLPYINDPSNNNPKFQRTKVRAIVKNLAPETKQFWLKALSHHHTNSLKYSSYTRACLKKALVFWGDGHAHLSLRPFLSSPPAIQRNVLRTMIHHIAGYTKRPLLQRSLYKLCTRILALSPKAQTLGGCLIQLVDNKIEFWREWARIVPLTSIAKKSDLLWDHRFFIELSDHAFHYPELSIRPLGKSVKLYQVPSCLHYIYASWPALYTQNIFLGHAGEKQFFKRCQWIHKKIFPQKLSSPLPGDEAFDLFHMKPKDLPPRA
jgi:tRNA(Ile)-lysidine synthase